MKQTQLEYESVEATESVMNQRILFSKDDIIPVVHDGQLVAQLTVNWIQRVGISDWYNSKANVAGISYSYTCNFHIKCEDGVADTLYVNASIEDESNGTVIGSPCEVGWTGFPKICQFYDNTSELDFEIGVQPEVANADDGLLIIKITDDDGGAYDDIAFDSSVLKSAEDTVGLENDSRIVHSINGAIFSVGIDDVSINDIYNKRNSERIARFLDVGVMVSYNDQIVNDRENKLFTDGLLNTKQVIGACTNLDDDVKFESDDSATRKLWSNSEKVGEYTTLNFHNLSPGEAAHYVTNRVLSTEDDPANVRFWVEFPAEANARTLSEMKDFDGRFLVIQKNITERALEEKVVK